MLSSVSLWLLAFLLILHSQSSSLSPSKVTTLFSRDLSVPSSDVVCCWLLLYHLKGLKIHFSWFLTSLFLCSIFARTFGRKWQKFRWNSSKLRGTYWLTHFLDLTVLLLRTRLWRTDTWPPFVTKQNHTYFWDFFFLYYFRSSNGFFRLFIPEYPECLSYSGKNFQKEEGDTCMGKISLASSCQRNKPFLCFYIRSLG